MMTKAKQRFIAIVLAIAVMTSVIVTVNIMSPVSAEASSDFMDIPQITVSCRPPGLVRRVKPLQYESSISCRKPVSCRPPGPELLG